MDAFEREKRLPLSSYHRFLQIDNEVLLRDQKNSIIL